MIPEDQENNQGVPVIFTIGLMEFFLWIGLYISYRQHQPGFIILALFILVTVNLAKLWKRLSPLKLKYSMNFDKQRVFPDEKITVTLTVENVKFLPIWLRAQLPVDDAFYSRQSTPPELVNEAGLLGYHRIHWQWEVTAGQRGWYTMGPLHLMTGDLLGFFLRPKFTEALQRVIVYPRLIPLKPFFLRKMESFGLVGSSSPVVDPVNLVGTREYQSGSPAKYIHWKASVRHCRLQEKLCEPTVQLKVLLLIDVSSFAVNQNKSGFERALEVLASLAFRFDSFGYPIGLVTNGVVAEDGPTVHLVTHNPQQLATIMETLAKLQLQSDGQLTEILCGGGMELPWGVSCIYLADQLDLETLSVKDFLTQRHIPVACIINQSADDSGCNRELMNTPCFSLHEVSEEPNERTC